MATLSSTVEVTIDTSAVDPFLKEKSGAIRAALEQRMGAISSMLKDKIVTGKLSGQLLNVRTGKLRNSVRMDEVVVSEAEIAGGVLAGGGPVDYAAPLEYRSKPHIIVPKNKKALAFEVSGASSYSPWGGMFAAKDNMMVIVKSVHHPGTKEYAFMRGTLAENADTIKAEFQDAASEGAKA